MLQNKRASKSTRILKRKTPSKKISILIKKRKKTKKHFSALNGKRLVATCSSKNLAKSYKKPNRPFGGILTSSQSREVIKYRALLSSNQITLDQIPLFYHKFLNLEKLQKNKE
ncbi:MAG: hypothetical protein ACK4J0_02655 [Candidatus Anstonellaceae archaeon]